MIYQHSIDKIFDPNARKRQTCRIVNPGEELYIQEFSGGDIPPKKAVVRPNGSVRYGTGMIRAIQPGRGKSGVWASVNFPGYVTTDALKRVYGLNWEQEAVAHGFGKAFMWIKDIERVDVRGMEFDQYRREGLVFAESYWDLRYLFLREWWCPDHDKNAAKLAKTMTRSNWIDFIKRRPAKRYDAWALTFDVILLDGKGQKVGEL